MIESAIREISAGLWTVLVTVDANRFEIVDDRGLKGAVTDALRSLNINLTQHNVMMMVLTDMYDNEYLDIWFKDKLDATKFFLSFC